MPDTGTNGVKSEFKVILNLDLQVDTKAAAEQFISDLTTLLRKHRRLHGRSALCGMAEVVHTQTSSTAEPWQLNDNGYADSGHRRLTETGETKLER